MSDPLRTDGPRIPETASADDRDAKIERLLLAGLDCYVAAQYEQAVNIWTRVLFLDRTHPRARAYIERARSALAERQRESEELLENGVAAFQRGDGREASRLLKAAIETGVPPEDALGLLDRLNRLAGALGDDPPRPGSTAGDAGVRSEQAAPASSFRQTLVASLVGAVVTLGLLALAAWEYPIWRSRSAWPDVPAASSVGPQQTETMLPLPRQGEAGLARAQALAAGGHLHDAVRVLGTIRLTDPERPVADRLRADIQRQLLTLAPLTGPAPLPAPADPRGSASSADSAAFPNEGPTIPRAGPAPAARGTRDPGRP